jgi:hypothetical protein
MNIFQRIGLALITGYVWFFTGERVFWSFWRPHDSLGDMILTWLLYSFFAYICLICISEFKVRSASAMFLVAALFGWLVEGLFSLTMFGVGGISIWASISWTGLAWHAMCILFCWYWMRDAVQHSTKKTLLGATAFGILWGVWSLWWVFETPPVFSTVPASFSYGILFTTFYILALHAYAWIGKGSFRATLTEKVILAGICFAYFAFVTVPAAPVLALTELPVLYALIYLGLRRNRQIETAPNVLTSFQTPIPWGRSLLLFIAPVLATTIFSLGFHALTNYLFLGVLTPLGFGLFLWSFWAIFRPRGSA